MAASKKFFIDIDLQGNGLNNSTVGANANMTKAGSFQYNAAETRLEYFNGSLVEQVANLSDISAVTGGLILQGAYDAATNTPNITDGNALKGYFWVVTVAGTFLGETVQVGDSIIAKVDEAGALLTDWLILQGNVVIATTEVAGISRLATQEEVNTGTEGGAVVVTPATLQGKIDAQITPEINNKLPLAGGTMSGAIDMDDFNIINLGAPTNGGDATNKTYVDGVGATAESNANTYTDTQITAQSFTASIPTGDWVYDAPTDSYKVQINHNLNCSFPLVNFYFFPGFNAEFVYSNNSANFIRVFSNTIPSNTVTVAIAKVTPAV